MTKLTRLFTEQGQSPARVLAALEAKTGQLA